MSDSEHDAYIAKQKAAAERLGLDGVLWGLNEQREGPVSQFEQALQIAVKAHAGQTDKAGQPYILHVLRVMLAVPKGEAQIVALLHDVVEDSTWTFPLLAAQGFSAEVVQAVDAITRQADCAYASYIERVGRNPLATVVKMADLRDNLGGSRRAALTDEHRRRYEKAYAKLCDSRAAFPPPQPEP